MPTLLFVILPYPSHYLASFGFAKMWQERGYKIVFTGFDRHRDLIEKEGFLFETLYYGHVTYVRTMQVFLGLWLRTTFDKTDVKRRYREYYNRVQAIRYLVEQYRPEIVFLDDHVGHYALYLANYSQPIIVINTKLATRKRANTPPLNTSFYPSFSLWSHFYCQWLWAKHITFRHYKSFLENLTFNGTGELTFQRHLAKQLGVDTRKLFNQQNAFYDGLRHIPAVVLAPDSLEIAPPNADEIVFYCNPLIERDESALLTKDYQHLRSSLKQAQKERGTKIILVAFGTLSGMADKKVKLFMEKLVAASMFHPDWHLIVSTTGLNVQLPTLPNLSVVNFVPQMDALTWVDAMITHGGLTTIKECLQAQVPMLIYPYNYKFDAPGNAVRVTKKGWGMYGSMDEDSVAIIVQKLSRVLDLKLPKLKPDLELPNGLLALLNQKKDLAESQINKFFTYI
jgi:zeaxanthin glucosyltransferase